MEQKFCCDLKYCKGACCIHGDSGAPLEAEELKIIEEILPVIKPYLAKENLRAIAKQGCHLVDEEGDQVTPLVNGKECAYTYFKNGIAYCAIERAYNEGKTDFQKPLSCHLYPVRIKKYDTFEAVNFNEWEICKPAKELGEKRNIRVFEFVKEALVRKYGEEWWDIISDIK